MFLILHLEEIREAGRILTGQTQEIEIYHFLIKGTVFDFHLSHGGFCQPSDLCFSYFGQPIYINLSNCGVAFK